MGPSTTTKAADRLVLACECSPLSLAHARAVTEQMAVLHPRLAVEVRPLGSAGARGARGRAVRRAFRGIERKSVDAVVVSVEEMATDLPAGLEIIAVMDRLAPFQALVSGEGVLLDELPAGARVGVRDDLSRFQLASHRSDLSPLLCRQTLASYMKWVRRAKLDALIAPVAELELLGGQDAVSEVLDGSLFLPPPGRGAFALVSARTNLRPAKWLGTLDDAPTRTAIEIERALVQEMNAVDGHLGALAQVSGSAIVVEAALWSPDGQEVVRDSLTGQIESGEELGRELAEKLLEDGGKELLQGQRRFARALGKVSKRLSGRE